MSKFYEVAAIENGVLYRGGIKTSKKTAQAWADRNNANFPDVKCFVVEADADAITWKEYLAECAAARGSFEK